MGKISNAIRARLLAGAAAGVLVLGANAAWAQSDTVSIPAQPLADALLEFANQTGRAIMFTPAVAASKQTAGVSGVADQQAALTQLLTGTGLTFRSEGEAFVIVQAGEGGSSPQGASAAGGGAEVEALIVTAQKREEAIQDVPIAISAFTARSLEEQKIEGGFDLMKAIPNVTFSKSNFSGYNFSIRGVGTKAVSATTDQGVAVAFNNTTLIHNRLFEQEYFDVERVEVLRGPQGTLYGRNATSGVINVITAKPRFNEFEASLKLEAGNYDARRAVGMVNIPIVQDVLSVRAAGSLTQRSGYDFNSITGNNVNGRDLWSGRVTIGFEPTDRIRTNLIWEHFEEDDNRSRTGKQLCHSDPGKQVVGGTSVVGTLSNDFLKQMRPALFSQGCLPGSLYADEAFGTPNGLTLPFVFGMLVIGADCGAGCSTFFPYGIGPDGRAQTLLQVKDPYEGKMQSRDLRTIASIRDPVYRAKADIYELNVDFDLTDSLTVVSQTAYNEDQVYSFQDYNRFNSAPMFTDSLALRASNFGTPESNPSQWREMAPNGVFCDPQIGCTDRIAGFDISKSESTQFSQELRVQSSFDGPVNFSLGANYTKFETEIDYYVMYNLISALAQMPPFYAAQGGPMDIGTCWPGLLAGGPAGVPSGTPGTTCPYIDPNPVESINGEGHNYFRSRNPYELKSKAAFGEFYWELNEALKLTAGLRYTEDQKTFIPVPSQVLLAPGVVAGGTVSRGSPEKEPIVQEWGEWTGRLGLDWKPELGITDQTLLYAFYSRGYKGGGANPPSPGFATLEESRAGYDAAGGTEAGWQQALAFGFYPVLTLSAVEYGPTFEPEFVDAFELGAKNTLLAGAMTLNATAFYYDYKGYQVSQIRDRTAVNENFDATTWGLEFETVFAPTRDFRINANLGYLDTEIAEGQSSIDIMNRTQGDPDYVLVKPWPQLPSNCVVPVYVAEAYLRTASGLNRYQTLCGVNGIVGGGNSFKVVDPFTGEPYSPDPYPELNGGAGLLDDVGGNELPNAPHWTANIGVQFSRDIGSWRATARTDAYWQSQSWARVYNAANDKLHGWYNLNLSVWLEQPDWGVKVEFYAKNILDHTPITDAFLNSDDSALTTNVFFLDPRLVGLSIRKEF